MARFPRINPISEGWFAKQTPIQYVGITVEHCPQCRAQSSHDVYVAMLGRHGGVGLPFFLTPMFRHVSTAGKVGQRSRWGQCSDCRSVLPHDETAQAYAEQHGYPDGFLNDPSEESSRGPEADVDTEADTHTGADTDTDDDPPPRGPR